MKLILYQAPFAITEIDFVPGPFRFQNELGHLDFAVGLSAIPVNHILGIFTTAHFQGPMT